MLTMWDTENLSIERSYQLSHLVRAKHIRVYALVFLVILGCLFPKSTNTAQKPIQKDKRQAERSNVITRFLKTNKEAISLTVLTVYGLLMCGLGVYLDYALDHLNGSATPSNQMRTSPEDASNEWGQGYGAGERSGRIAGHTTGYTEGYAIGFDAGYFRGHSVGQEEGRIAQHESSYHAGYRDGWAEVLYRHYGVPRPNSSGNEAVVIFEGAKRGLRVMLR